MKNLYVIFFSTILLFSAVQTAFAQYSSAPIKAPELSMLDSNMQKVQLSSFTGKPILLSFWVSATEISRANIRSIDAFYNEFSSAVHFVVVNIADGRRDSIPTAGAFLLKEKISFPVFFVTDDINYKYNTLPMTVPMTLLIDKNGFIVHRFYDVVSRDDLIRELSALN